MKKIFMIMTLLALVAAGPGMVFAGDDDGNKPRGEDDPGDCIPTPNEYEGPPVDLCDVLPSLPFCEAD